MVSHKNQSIVIIEVFLLFDLYVFLSHLCLSEGVYLLKFALTHITVNDFIGLYDHLANNLCAQIDAEKRFKNQKKEANY